MTQIPTLPTPAEVKAARLSAGLTQTQAAAISGQGLRWWQKLEKGDATFRPALWRDWNNEVKRMKETGELK